MRQTAAAIALFMLCGVASAAPATDRQHQDTRVQVVPEAVSGFNFFGRIDSWRAIDRETLIVWATPFRPYLIKLGRPSHDLRFAHVIAITSTVGRVQSRLDEVRIDGWSYRIKAIYRLTPDQARNWGRTKAAAQ